MPIELRSLAGEFSVCRLPAGSPAPTPPRSADFFMLSITADEVSVVCRSGTEPDTAVVESGWSVLYVAGQLDFTLVGILSSLTKPLAEAAIPVFAASTYDTDYLLVKTTQLDHAKRVLESEGHVVT